MADIHYASRVYSIRKVFRVDFSEPTTAQARHLQQMLNEAHTHFFRRRHVKAMELYKSIWWWIHHFVAPELPQLDYGSSFDFDIVPKPEFFDPLVTRLKDLLEVVDPGLLIRLA